MVSVGCSRSVARLLTPRMTPACGIPDALASPQQRISYYNNSRSWPSSRPLAASRPASGLQFRNQLGAHHAASTHLRPPPSVSSSGDPRCATSPPSPRAPAPPAARRAPPASACGSRYGPRAPSPRGAPRGVRAERMRRRCFLVAPG